MLATAVPIFAVESQANVLSANTAALAEVVVRNLVASCVEECSTLAEERRIDVYNRIARLTSVPSDIAHGVEAVLQPLILGMIASAENATSIEITTSGDDASFCLMISVNGDVVDNHLHAFDHQFGDAINAAKAHALSLRFEAERLIGTKAVLQLNTVLHTLPANDRQRGLAVVQKMSGTDAKLPETFQPVILHLHTPQNATDRLCQAILDLRTRQAANLASNDDVSPIGERHATA
jgi:hypothetical protein